MHPLPLRRALTALKWLFATLFALLLAALARPAWTPAVSTTDGVATLAQERLGGRMQWVLTRGEHRDRPVLLFLHGGPGMPAMFLAHASTRELERDFVVVHWDRRDAGKSFDPEMPREDEKVSVQLGDAEQLITRLRQRFGQRRIILLGHSWGTYLGMLLAARHPDWFAAYVGVGQVTNKTNERAVADRFLRAEAQRRGDREALAELRAHPDEVREKWLFAYGAELYGSTSFLPLVSAGLQAPEYTLLEALGVGRGSQFASRHLQYDVAPIDLTDAVAGVDVPVYMIAGRHDHNTPGVLAEAYLERLRAPHKRMIFFEHSAHFPFLEEPRHFARTLRDIRDAAPVAARLASR